MNKLAKIISYLVVFQMGVALAQHDLIKMLMFGIAFLFAYSLIDKK